MKEKAEQILSIKEELKTALNNKGIEVGDKFSEYPAKIGEVDTDPYEVLGYDSTLYDQIKEDVANSKSCSLAFYPFGGMVYPATYQGNVTYLPKGTLVENATQFSCAPTLQIYKLNLPNLRYVPPMETSNLTSLYIGFWNTKLENFPEWDYSNVTNFGYSFYNTNIKNIDISNWKNAQSCLYTFCNCKYLESVGDIDLPEATDTNSMFSNCYLLTTVGNVTLPKCTDAAFLFRKCYILSTVGTINLPAATSLKYMFDECYNLTTINSITAPLATDFTKFCSSSLTNCTFYELGTSESCTSLDFSSLTSWGTGSVVAATSVLDSIVTNSYDRAAAGYSACTVVLTADTYNAVTTSASPFVQDATAKGYTITVV